MDGGGLQERIAERNNARKLCGEMQASSNFKHLLPRVITLMAHQDIGVKRIAYSAYARHSYKVPGEALLAINTLLQDSCHPSPLVRALVLNTLAFTHRKTSAGIQQKIITDGLSDTSAFVRRHAVVAHHSFALSADDGQHSKSLVADPDPIVSSLSLALAGSLDVSHCLARIGDYTPDGLLQVLAALKSHSPAQQEMLDILNVLDPLLSSEHIDIATAVMDVFLLYSQQAEKSLATDLHSTILKCCLKFLRSADGDEVYCMLLWLEECLKSHPSQGQASESSSSIDYEILLDNYHLLLNKPRDPPYLAMLKLDILRLFVREDNLNIVADNVKAVLQSHQKTASICDRAVFFAISLRKEFSDTASRLLNELLCYTQPEIQAALLRQLPLITSDGLQCEPLFRALLPKWRTLTSQEVIIFLNLASEIGSNHSENVKHLIAIADHLLAPTSRPSQATKVTLLNCLTSCFLSEPAEYRDSLESCLTRLEGDSDLVVQQQVQWCVSKLRNSLTALTEDAI
ncbi:AP-4 complex subunit beta-1-like [Watersipora subatra]|uniref:AP-4 complex subunit beta-1-like n=1 Tax=Watersipora subatra TaxID=2589382 RepID=UPI00355ADD88